MSVTFVQTMMLFWGAGLIGALAYLKWNRSQRYDLLQDAARRGIRTSNGPFSWNLLWIDVNDPKCPERIRREYKRLHREFLLIGFVHLAVLAVMIISFKLGGG